MLVPKHRKCPTGWRNVEDYELLKNSGLKVMIIFVLLLICGTSLFVYFFIQAHDSAVSLGNGYRYFGAKYGRTVIDRGYASEAERQRAYETWDDNTCQDVECDPDDVGFPRVGPNVDGYCVYPGIIVGHVSKPRKDCTEDGSADAYSNKYARSGYFIIDTSANRVYRGLSKQEWRIRLRKYGVDREPKLFKPSKSDVHLGHNKPQPLSNCMLRG